MFWRNTQVSSSLFFSLTSLGRSFTIIFFHPLYFSISIFRFFLILLFSHKKGARVRACSTVSQVVVQPVYSVKTIFSAYYFRLFVILFTEFGNILTRNTLILCLFSTPLPLNFRLERTDYTHSILMLI